MPRVTAVFFEGGCDKNREKGPALPIEGKVAVPKIIACLWAASEWPMPQIHPHIQQQTNQPACLGVHPYTCIFQGLSMQADGRHHSMFEPLAQGNPVMPT